MTIVVSRFNWSTNQMQEEYRVDTEIALLKRKIQNLIETQLTLVERAELFRLLDNPIELENFKDIVYPSPDEADDDPYATDDYWPFDDTRLS
jgi:hypothetical protein